MQNKTPTATHSQQSKYCFGQAAVGPKQKEILSPDSKAGDFLKPTVHKACFKMGSFLVELDDNIDLNEWTVTPTEKKTVLSRQMSWIEVYTPAFMPDHIFSGAHV